MYISIMILCVLSGTAVHARTHVRTAGRCFLEIRVSGELTGRYDITADRDITVEAFHGEVNTVQIRGGQVRMVSASCPNRLCVRHNAVSRPGEQIVCLPNRVTLTLTAEEEKEAVDAIAR